LTEKLLDFHLKKEVKQKSFSKKIEILAYTLHQPGQVDERKPALFINSLQHAREWIGPPTALYSVYKILSSYGNDAKIKNLLDKINIYYV
jgi:hypothetical protein